MTDDVQHLIEFLSLPPHAVLEGDCLERVRRLPDNSVDAIVTDPPYGLGKEPDALAMLADWLGTGHHDVKGSGFMGKAWDAFVPQPALWRECLRVLKPGGHLLAFAGTRTHDLMTLGLRIAGFEIRDTIMWVYGSGFPKSLDVSKAIDKAAGAEREVVGRRAVAVGFDTEKQGGGGWSAGEVLTTVPASDAARRWEGWGTALKPALEPITVARKPLDGTVAANVLAHGTGAINIDGCRVGDTVETWPATRAMPADSRDLHHDYTGSETRTVETGSAPAGRWPANLIHDGSDEVLAGFPNTSARGNSGPSQSEMKNVNCYSGGWGSRDCGVRFNRDSGGSAARFFYCAKASKADRDEGNTHPTVKPTALMRWLVRLVTPPGGLVLDPFAGSGSTGKACKLEGFRFIGCELDPEYAAIARARIEGASE